VSIFFLLRQFGASSLLLHPPKKVPESKDASSGLAFWRSGQAKINKHFPTGAAVIRFALRPEAKGRTGELKLKSMVKTVKNEKLSEPQASFFV
jgi:hypothetical protein